MWTKKWGKDYLSFNRSDRLAVLALVSLIILLFFIPRLSSRLHSRITIAPDTAWMASVSELPGLEADSGDDTNKTQHWQYDRTQYNTPPVATLFHFNPNTLDHDGWKRLGIRDKTIQTILNYRAKGGRFRKAEDLSRIYGLRGQEYEQLKPYVRIPEQAAPEKNNDIKSPVRSFVKSPAVKYTTVDINLADTTAFIDLPGIGGKLAARIVNFRDKLGGFYSIGQVGETFGLADSVFQKIRPYLKIENGTLKKINVNTATADQLKAHPYIRYAIAKTIIAFREQHGLFVSVDDLKKINTITDEVFSKIAPYLEL